MDNELMVLFSLTLGVFMGISFAAMYYLSKKDSGYLDRPVDEIKNVKIWSRLR